MENEKSLGWQIGKIVIAYVLISIAAAIVSNAIGAPIGVAGWAVMSHGVSNLFMTAQRSKAKQIKAIGIGIAVFAIAAQIAQ